MTRSTLLLNTLKALETRCTKVSVQTLGLIALATTIALIPAPATAVQMTLTFDAGAYDETILYPGGDQHGPYDWIETNGIRSTGIWATNVGTPGASFKQGHTHVTPNWKGNADGYVERMHSWTSDLIGIYISLESGASFDVVSINYSITQRDSTDPETLRLGWLNGPEDARLLLTTAFDPTASDLESQWTPFGIDDYGLSGQPWLTREITGFTDVTGVYISHTLAGVAIDNIVINVNPAVPIPEPSTALLLTLGLGYVATRRLRAQKPKRTGRMNGVFRLASTP